MQVHRSSVIYQAIERPVITIGTFDGVHQGHRKIIGALAEEAKRINGKAVLITFDPHPRKVLLPGNTLQLINTLEEKIELLSSTSLDHLVIVPFTPAFSEITAEEYISDFLVKQFHPSTIIIGYDHHFGKERQGSFHMLKRKSADYNYRLLEIPRYMINEAVVSSTLIRQALVNSDIEIANKLLGYSFFFEGIVVHGDHLGRQLGYPTANLEYTDQAKIHTGHGVYAVYAEVDGRSFKGMLSIGNRPTIRHSDEKTEVHLFNADLDLYGKTIRVYIRHFLRKQEQYKSLHELKMQLDKDKENSLSYL